MRKTLTLSIPAPCHENWNDMTPVDKGRHCAVCTKTVYDFTNKTDEQIVKAYLNNRNLCGRFKGKQLNKELVYSRKTTNSFRTFLASSLLSFLSFTSHQALSQEKPIAEQTDTTKQPTVKGKTAVSVLNSKTISGTIADESGLPLPGVNIIIKGTTRGTQTDFDGNYKITASLGNIVSFSYLGYKTKEVTIGVNNDHSFCMDIDSEILGEVVYTGMISYSESYDQGYGYIQNHYDNNYTTPEEITKQKIAKNNTKSFYKNKFMQDKALRKEKREKIKSGELERSNLGKFFYSITHPFK
ncbi:carboxypeptidase-like regulatory domain-containing protein [Hanstruepera flava]|uniref:carboxypeptidase-like regulatory domain-containing protein n=1 Tax=Hanstruepera flava TaxID=2930218 RepID=UPI002028138E|nr:carboxypeptidase-like regulatory domain-containing protein [Hanstruepera flava]